MDLHVDDDIRRARGLPADCFTSEAFAEAERAAIFGRAWTLLPSPAGRGARSLLEEVATRGARVPAALLGRPAFLQRGWDDDALRLFPNACTHAWYPLVHGASRSPSLTCAQHGRKIDCRGRFVSQPGFDGVAACEDDHLRELAVDEWNGLLFGSWEPPARALADVLRPVTESLSGLGLERLRRAPEAGSVREVEGNWKLHVLNYMDSFHVTFIHRAPGGLADRIDMGSYRTELLQESSLQWAWARDARDGFDPAALPERFRDERGRRVFALWWLVFPSTAINAYPWGLSINSWQPVPGRPDRTMLAWEHLVLDDELHAQRDERWLSAQVDAEDVEAIAQVRRGLASGCAPRTRFAPQAEAGPHWFHRLVSRAMGSDP